MDDIDSTLFRRLIYRSKSTLDDAHRDRERPRILAQCRMNNGLEAVSGILLTKEDRYIQVLEGSSESIDHVFALIKADGRHTDIDVVEDVPAPRRMFGGWAMASLDEADSGDVVAHIDRFLAKATKKVQWAFAGMI